MMRLSHDSGEGDQGTGRRLGTDVRSCSLLCGNLHRPRPFSRNLLPGSELATAGAHHRERQKRPDEQTQPPYQGNPRTISDAPFPTVTQPVMKTPPRPRMDVNLEELDQIIDGGMRAPLSESDGEKLKAVLHILAERAKPRWRTTEKTRAVLPQLPSSEPAVEKPSPESGSQPKKGHGRNRAAKFTGARPVTVPHKTLHPGDACPELIQFPLRRFRTIARPVRAFSSAKLVVSAANWAVRRFVEFLMRSRSFRSQDTAKRQCCNFQSGRYSWPKRRWLPGLRRSVRTLC